MTYKSNICPICIQNQWEQNLEFDSEPKDYVEGYVRLEPCPFHKSQLKDEYFDLAAQILYGEYHKQEAAKTGRK